MRRLSAEERALWRRVTAGVAPLGGKALPAEPPAPATPRRQPAAPPPALRPASRRQPGETLDGGWDRRLTKGRVEPDVVIDLHGHTLGSAHAVLERRLGEVLAQGARVILLVTGNPPRGAGAARGVIRASVGGWLDASPHAGRIAAIRPAHPRHGGTGALYLILRRPRAPL